MRQRAHGIALAVCVQRFRAQCLGAQAQHPHEQQHIERGTQLERVQSPEIHGNPATDDTNHRGRGSEVNRPGQQQAAAHGVAEARTAQGTRNVREGTI